MGWCKAAATVPSLIRAFQDIGVKFSTPADAGIPAKMVYPNRLDFSPRAGFAWRLTSGRLPTSLRGGYGLFRFPLALRQFAAQMRGTPPMDARFSMDWGSASRTPDGFSNYLLRSVPTVFAGVNSRDILDPNMTPDISPGGFTVGYFDPHQPTSRNHQWNLTLERELLENTVFRAGYVGTHGAALDQWLELNGQPNNYVWMVRTGLPAPTGRYAGTARRLFDQTTYGSITKYVKTGYANYNSLQLEVLRRYSRGYGFQFIYVMANSFRTQGGNNTGTVEATVGDPGIYLPGAVPEDPGQRSRFLTYVRDTAIPKQRLRWNWLVDLPIGRGKRLFGNPSGWKQRAIGGWQIAGSGSGRSKYFDLPTGNWGPIGPVELYGKKYPIQDCRSGQCVPGYLWYNGYIPANRINSYDAQGRPNGVMGVPSGYRPAHQPLNPIPANGGSPADPNFALYETNNTFLTLKDGSVIRTGMDTGLHPWRNQFQPAPWGWGLDASIFKTIPVTERVFLRFNADVFNVLNHPGVPGVDNATGIVSLRTSANDPRQVQLTLRLTW